MKKIIIGFVLLLTSLFLTWLLRDLLLAGFFIPIVLGAVRLGQLLDTVPQIVWWIVIILGSCSLFFTNVSLPEIQIIKRKRKKYLRGRLEVINGLIEETGKGSSWSGSQLALLIVNLYRKTEGLEDITIHGLPDELSKGKLPGEISSFVRLQYQPSKRRSDSAMRLSMEKAVRFLKENNRGDRKYDRS